MTSSDPNVLSVERTIDAPASAIFDLLADPDKHAAIDGGQSVRGSRGGSRRLGLGDRFGMDMHLGAAYQTINEVTEFEENRVIAWRTFGPKPVRTFFTGRTWRYELEPVDDGTRVRQTWDLRTEAPMLRPLVRLVMTKMTRRNMRATMRRIEELVTGN